MLTRPSYFDQEYLDLDYRTSALFYAVSCREPNRNMAHFCKNDMLLAQKVELCLT